MKNYYCPYCNPKYQFHKKSKTGELICGLCGDPLIRKSFFKVNKMIAVFACFSLVLPMIYTFIFLIKYQINPPRKNYQANVNPIQKVSKLKINQPLHNDLFKQEFLLSIFI